MRGVRVKVSGVACSALLRAILLLVAATSILGVTPSLTMAEFRTTRLSAGFLKCFDATNQTNYGFDRSGRAELRRQTGWLEQAWAAQHPSHAREDALLAAAKTAIDKDESVFADLQALESEALAAAGADAVRQGKTLTLHLKSGATKSYEDRPECESPSQEAKCQKYVLIAHARSRGMFLVARLYYEWAEFALIDDASGDETILRAFPVFSPSGSYVLVLLMNDEEVGSGMQIWRREGHKFVLDGSASPYTNGIYTSYRLIRWRSEDAIELRAETSFVPPKPSVTRYFQLRHSAHGWRVVEAR